MMLLVPLLLPLLLAGSDRLTQAADNYVAEIYFVADPSVVANYMKMGYSSSDARSTLSGDIDFMIYEINKYFKGMAGLNLEVRKKKLDILTSPIFDDCKVLYGTDLQADFALAVFREWLADNKIYDNIGYDMAVVWTGHDLFSHKGKGTAGYAATNAVCSPGHAVGIAEFHGTQSTAITTAHEIAHTLGSPHDASSNCDPNDGYIMAPSSSPNNQHRWDFSTCTVNSIINNINDLNAKNENCMDSESTTARDPEFHMSSQIGRDIMDADKTCQRAVNFASSHICKSLTKAEEVCESLYCLNDEGTCTLTTPPEGMPCELDKRCSRGQCVAATADFPQDKEVNFNTQTNPTETNTAEECTSGDKGFIMSGTSWECSDYVATAGRVACYQVASLCCTTCGAVKSGDLDCPYGDRGGLTYSDGSKTSCSEYVSGGGSCSGLENHCCAACGPKKRSIPGDMLLDSVKRTKGARRSVSVPLPNVEQPQVDPVPVYTTTD